MAGRPWVGLDIGTSGVRAAELRSGRGQLTLERFGQVALPTGAVRDGEVVEVDVVAEAIRSLWAQARFASKQVVLGVANQKVVVRLIELPWLPPAELRASLAFQVQEVIPMPVEQAVLDLHPLEEFTADNGVRSVRALLVAASRDMVGNALDAVTRAGLHPTRVDLNGFAVLRAMAHAGSGLPTVHAEALVDVGSSVTNIVVHQAGVPRFVRVLLMGGGDITEALAARLGVPLEQADQVKQALGLATGRDDREDEPAHQTLEQVGSTFVDEVRGSLDYHLAQPGATRLSRVVLSGGGSQLPGLAERLSAATRLPVEHARPLATLRLGRTGLSDEQLAYVEPLVAVPVGLALGLAS